MLLALNWQVQYLQCATEKEVAENYISFGTSWSLILKLNVDEPVPLYKYKSAGHFDNRNQPHYHQSAKDLYQIS